MPGQESEEASKKRAPEADDEDDDADIGPMPAAAVEEEPTRKRKKQKTLEHESLYLANLPLITMYEKSLMHRDIVNFVEVTKTDFIITTSIDGHIKFWKKTERGIEFVKHYRAHLGAVVAIAVSDDGSLLATAGADKALKIFDIINFDMINLIKLSFLPKAICWIFRKGEAQAWLACTDRDSSAIHIFDGRGDATPSHTISNLHNHPVTIVKYNASAEVVLSVDDQGYVEYWEPDPSQEFPQPLPPKVTWEFKSDTDLYEFKKLQTVPSSLNFSKDYSKFVTFGFGDRIVRIFNFATGKIIKKYDESLDAISEMQQKATAKDKLDDMEFGRRLALEREIEKTPGGQASTVNAVFDESGHFLLYPTLFGIKVINITTNRVVKVIGRGETQRFMNLALYQGAPRKKTLITMAMAASDNPALQNAELSDPTLFCTAYKRNRFYLFTQRDPNEAQEQGTAGGGRDIFNEKPSREEMTVASASAMSLKQALGSTAIIHTTMGDIHIRFFPEYAPKAVENFVGLAKKGYYNNLIFHRVIKGFMLQTGCPFGDGTGGDSLWGSDFEDEFHKAIKHDRPYTVSMANAGPGTNASQFFITTAPTPWLDNKHTIFGRATAGMDVIHLIENVKVDKNDKPWQDVKVLSIEVR
ncbi:hypothetical protein SmJEL517_g03184 [Synchytrium microbalum]|uniref:peptidylprolyl isomerase n=1 Tax=Synchytrium microbalum TaxID=1806994 RepID=A0A507C3J8_9FUNG|nr:uncharacterized protein SmJEL517_g03184 [Synchytrium microbalum]TPX34041.1 hypothetical protein SmJEL517_g03184 [Synchytrium microbalum]